MTLLLMTGERAREVGLFQRPEESVSLLFWDPTNVSTLFINHDLLYLFF